MSHRITARQLLLACFPEIHWDDTYSSWIILKGIVSLAYLTGRDGNFDFLYKPLEKHMQDFAKNKNKHER